MKNKITIIGAGYVGATIAYALTLKGIADDIVLVDIDEKKAQAEADDIQHGVAAMGDSAVRAGTYADTADSDLIIIIAGRNRKPTETRLDMIHDNIGIIKDVCEQLKKHGARGVVLLVSNPVDILTYYCDKWLGLPDGTVFGTGCTLDTSRLLRAVADYTGSPVSEVSGYVIGEHGESQVPVWSGITVQQKPFADYCALHGFEEIKQTIQDRVKSLGTRIIAAKGRTHYGIATCVCMLADAVLHQKETLASVTSPLHGEYGLQEVALSLPCIISGNGIVRKQVPSLTDEEQAKLKNSADKLKSTLMEMS